MIKIKNISKKINDNLILDKMDFEVKDKEIVGLVGPNGAGKTTLLNIVAGIWTKDSGAVELNDGIGYIPDTPYIYPKLTGREFLSFVGSLYKIDSKTLNRRISEIEKDLELTSWIDELMESYPRGVRQKSTLAAMLLHSPNILLLDEPLNNLDPKSSKVVKEILLNMVKKGASIILSTHILDIAEKLCQRIVIIHKGRKIAEGSISELKELAKNPDAELEEIFLQLTGEEK